MRVYNTSSIGISKKTGIIGILFLIATFGILAIINANGLTTTLVVIDEIDNKQSVERMATAYLNKVYEKAQNKHFFEQLGVLDIPPVPLTSEYTDSGKYSVETELDFISDSEVEVIVTYRRASDTYFSDPVLVASTTIKSPKMLDNEKNNE